MIRQQFAIENYWQVVVFYDVDFNHFAYISNDLSAAGAPASLIWELYDMLFFQKAKAATFSNEDKHMSVVLFNLHEDKADYVNSIAHEAEHVKQAMLRAYEVEDEGEPPAYTLGYLISRMYKVFRKLICNWRR